MKTNDDIIREEIEEIMQDVKRLYVDKDKKVSGQFERGLEAVYEPNKGTIKGYVYLAGRRAGKMPPVANLLSWVKKKGIFPPIIGRIFPVYKYYKLCKKTIPASSIKALGIKT